VYETILLAITGTIRIFSTTPENLRPGRLSREKRTSCPLYIEEISSSPTAASICISRIFSAMIKILGEALPVETTTVSPTLIFRSSTMPLMGEVIYAYWFISVSITLKFASATAKSEA
jgi:hypothetical protein